MVQQSSINPVEFTARSLKQIFAVHERLSRHPSIYQASLFLASPRVAAALVSFLQPAAHRHSLAHYHFLASDSDCGESAVCPPNRPIQRMKSESSPSISHRASPKTSPLDGEHRGRRIRSEPPGSGVRLRLGSTGSKELAGWLRGESSQQSAIRPDKTSLEKLFTTLMDLPAAPRKVYLFTDGWENQGNVQGILPAIAGSGLKIFPMLPAERLAIAC